MSHTECQRVPNLTSWQTMPWVYVECVQFVERIKLSWSVGAIVMLFVNSRLMSRYYVAHFSISLKQYRNVLCLIRGPFDTHNPS